MRWLLPLLVLTLPAPAPVPSPPAFPPAPAPVQPGLATGEPARGKLLVASRQLRDPNFYETVVLLTEHGSNGTVGLILNRPTRMRVADALPQVEALRGREDTLFLGGPVSRGALLMLVHSKTEPPEAQRVLPGVWLSSSLSLLERHAREPAPGEELRVYAGYAGWSPGQLEWELQRGGWNVLPGDEATVFGDPGAIWPRLIRRSTLRWVRLGAEERWEPGRRWR